MDYYKSVYPIVNGLEVTLLHNVFNDIDATELFNDLNDLPWNETLTEASARPRYDIYWYGPDKYKYSSVEHSKKEDRPPFIDTLFEKVNSLGKFEFNSVLLNRYMNGTGIRPHRDDESNLDKNHEILCLRFGATRPIDFLNNDNEIIKSFDIEGGSGYVMPIGFQDACLHKVTSEVKETTISLTFRKMIVKNDLSKDVSFSAELEKAKNLASTTDTLIHISEKLKLIEGNATFEAIKPFLLAQYGIIIQELYMKMNINVNLNSQKIVELNTNLNTMEKSNLNLNSKISKLENELENQRMYSNRSNLLIMGIPEDENEKSEKLDEISSN